MPTDYHKERYLAGILSVCALFTGACASATVSEYEANFWPPPPNTARVQFLGSYATSLDFEGNKRSFWDNLVGAAGEENRGIIKPYGLSVYDGKVYVCDSLQRSVEILDLRDGKYGFFLPEGPGQFGTPINCFVDPDTGWLYVSDTGREQILIFDERGQWVQAIDAGEGSRFADVFVTEESIWATDLRGATVRVFDKETRAESFRFPDVRSVRSDQEGWLGAATGLWVTDDRVYVSDTAGGEVLVYTRDGEYVMTVGSYGDGMGQFARPKGVAVDREGILYVVDSAFNNVQMFDAEGQLLMWFGGPELQPGQMAIPAQITIDYENTDLFESRVAAGYRLSYLILVTNQYGADKVAVYGFIERDEPGAPNLGN